MQTVLRFDGTNKVTVIHWWVYSYFLQPDKNRLANWKITSVKTKYAVADRWENLSLSLFMYVKVKLERDIRI